MSDIAIAALLAGTILLASMVSVEIGISVALIELVGGFVVGNAFSIDVPSWLSFIGHAKDSLRRLAAPLPRSISDPNRRLNWNSPQTGDAEPVSR